MIIGGLLPRFAIPLLRAYRSIFTNEVRGCGNSTFHYAAVPIERYTAKHASVYSGQQPEQWHGESPYVRRYIGGAPYLIRHHPRQPARTAIIVTATLLIRRNYSPTVSARGSKGCATLIKWSDLLTCYYLIIVT